MPCKVGLAWRFLKSLKSFEGTLLEIVRVWKDLEICGDT